LHRAVTTAVGARRELIEDACQTAWMMLLRTQPDRYAIFGWLRVVAIREAYRLSSIEQREATLEPARLDGREPGDAGDSSGLDTAVEALEALRAVAALPPRQRSDLTLKVAGYSYEEIRMLTGRRTFTNVSKSLAKARDCIRRSRP
jgi:DNA-directed RNA polymerase specialized sigma24 family protein